MAKRFTDTTKWRKGLLRGLEPKYKLLWLYLCDECDNAGIWEVELDVAALRLGFEYDEEDTLAAFGGKIVAFDGGEKWFIPSFIEFQYVALNPENKAHKPVIKAIEANRLDSFLCNSPRGIDPPSEAPHRAPLKGAQETDKETETEKERGCGGGDDLMPSMSWPHCEPDFDSTACEFVGPPGEPEPIPLVRPSPAVEELALRLSVGTGNLLEWVREYGEAWTQEALCLAEGKNNPTSYARAILQGWRRDGKPEKKHGNGNQRSKPRRENQASADKFAGCV